MSTGIRANYEVAVKAGFHYIKFNQADEQKYNAVKAYLSDMVPDPSPYLEDGNLSASAKRGKELFHSNKAGCYNCHSGAYLTDQKMHNIGTKGKYDRTDTFDTPTLIEAWRTAPYLHDGSVSSLEELFLDGSNTGHWHGFARNLNQNELLDLIQYVKSL
jgi:cytochrome c peroxidase